MSESRRKERGGPLHWTGLDRTGLGLVTGLRTGTGLATELTEFQTTDWSLATAVGT